MDNTQKEELVRQLRPIALHYASWLHLPTTDREDFVQECEWQAFRKGDDFLETLLDRPGARKRLHRFVRLVAANFRRSEELHHRREVPVADLLPPGKLNPPPDLPDPVSFEEGILFQVDLERALDDLPAEQRELYCRHHLDGEDYATLAKRYHTTEQAIRQRIYYIKQKLAVWWKIWEEGTG